MSYPPADRIPAAPSGHHAAVPVVGLLFVILPLVLLPLSSTELDRLYRNSEFDAIVEYLSGDAIGERDVRLHHLYIEALARSGKRHAARRQLESLRLRDGRSARFYATRGWVSFSCGDLLDADRSFQRGLALDARLLEARIGRCLLLLYLHRYGEAEKEFKRFLARHPGWRQTRQVFRAGIEIYTACHNYALLEDWYRDRARWLKKNGFSRQVANHLKENSRLFRRLKDKEPFHVSCGEGNVWVPLRRDRASSRYWIPLQLGTRTFRVVIDTGNATGWIVHSRDLADRLKLRRGGRTAVLMGTEIQALDGYHIIVGEVDFGPFRLSQLHGYYVPKPYPDFFDANLNPAFIRGCRIILDGKKQRLVLAPGPLPDRSDMETPSTVVLPWFGHEQPFVPVQLVDGEKGIGIIETGAEDLSLHESFARMNGLVLSPRKKFLANGDVYNYFVTSVRVLLGEHALYRPAAEVWPLNRFHNRLTGVGADVVIGPQALFETYRVCFDPFTFQIRLTEQ